MKKSFNISIDVTVSSDNEYDFDTVRRNLELLSTMAEDLKLVIDGTDAVLDKIKHTIKEKNGKRGRPPKRRSA